MVALFLFIFLLIGCGGCSDNPTVNMFLQETVPTIVAMLGSVLGLVLALLRTQVGKAITANVENAAIRSALDWAAGIVFEYVLSLKQTCVDQLKKDLADGKLTKEELERSLAVLKQAAVKELQSALSDRLFRSGAAKTAEDVKEIASTLVESAVAKSKALPELLDPGKTPQP